MNLHNIGNPDRKEVKVMPQIILYEWKIIFSGSLLHKTMIPWCQQKEVYSQGMMNVTTPSLWVPVKHHLMYIILNNIFKVGQLLTVCVCTDWIVKMHDSVLSQIFDLVFFQHLRTLGHSALRKYWGQSIRFTWWDPNRPVHVSKKNDFSKRISPSPQRFSSWSPAECGQVIGNDDENIICSTG